MLNNFLNIQPLIVCCLLPLIGASSLIFGILLNPENIKATLFKPWALFISILTFIFSLITWINFKALVMSFQQVYRCGFTTSYFETSFLIGIDGISLFFLLLTTFLIPICILSIWNIEYAILKYLALLLILEFFLVMSFLVLDLFLFYIFFESVLIPMVLIVGIWGSGERKIRAAYFFFLYTLLGSLFMLAAIGLLKLNLGATSYDILLNSNFSLLKQKILWLFCFFALAVKIPIFPFHVWLPEAHVEAPTTGSVILASLLLKLGGYGLIRFLIPIYPQASIYFLPLVYTMATLSIIYASLTTIRQIDLKRIIAYSSVAHMNLVVLGIFSFNIQGLSGSILLMVAHGIVSGGLFLMLGFLYVRYHTRLLYYYGGIAMTMPLFATFFLLFSLSNLGMPGTSNFIGETLILMGIFQTNTFIALLACSGMVFSATYSLWLYNRVSFGTLKLQYIKYYTDINRQEFYLLLPLACINLIIGIYPNFILNLCYPSLKYLLLFLYKS